MTLRASVVDTLSLWNSADPWKNQDNDFLFVHFLLIDIFGGKTLALKRLDDEKLAFVKEVFAYRVKNDEGRLASFESLRDQVADQFYNKLIAPDNDRLSQSSIRLSF